MMADYDMLTLRSVTAVGIDRRSELVSEQRFNVPLDTL